MPKNDNLQVPPPPPLPCYISAQQPPNTIIRAPTKCEMLKNSKPKSNGYPICYSSTNSNNNYGFVNKSIANTVTTNTDSVGRQHHSALALSANKHSNNNVAIADDDAINSIGCSRTIPISWTSGSSSSSATSSSSANQKHQQQHQTKTKTTITTTSSTTNKNKIVNSSNSSSNRTIAGCSLLQVYHTYIYIQIFLNIYI